MFLRVMVIKGPMLGVDDMAISERIQYFRKMSGMTQEYLGRAVGLPEGSAHTRIAQYESGIRVPKPEMVKQLAEVLGVSPRALTVGKINNYVDIAHTLFALEDLLELKAVYIDDTAYLKAKNGSRLEHVFRLWADKLTQLENGEITKEEYDAWRYTFPRGNRIERNK